MITKLHISVFGAILLSGLPAPLHAQESVPRQEVAGDAATREAVRAIAEKLRDNLGNAAAWKPTADQIAAIAATPEAAAKLTAYTDTIFAQLGDGKPAAKPGQTEIRVTGPDWKALPGGYTQQREHFKPGVKIYGFKYTKPGEETGMAFDGLFQVGEKWILIPKAWRAFRKG